MKTIVIALRIMLVIPVGLMIWHLFWPDDISELINLVIGLPIIVVNVWIWKEPELSREFIYGKEKPRSDNWSI